MTDATVLAGIQAGGSARNEVLRRLYLLHMPMAASLITRNSGSKADAEDLFQDTIATFYQHVVDKTFEGRSSIKSYLYALLHNKWMNELKRRGLGQKYQDMQKLAPEQPIETPVEAVLQKERAHLLQGLLAKLGESCRSLLRLRFFEYRAFKEIAEVMQYNTEQVAKTKQQKCLQRLRKLILDDDAANEILEGGI